MIPGIRKVMAWSQVENICLVVLLTLIPMLTFRFWPLLAPNEEPKWLVLILCGVFLSLSLFFWLWRSRPGSVGLRMSVYSSALIALFLIMGIGVFITPSLDDGMVRYSFWLASLAVWLIARVYMSSPGVRDGMLAALLTVAGSVFSMLYWWIYIQHYGQADYNMMAFFSSIGHVNFTSDVLIMLMPVMVWAFMIPQLPVLRLAAWFSATTMMTVLLLAASRGALGGLAFALLVFAVLAALMAWKKRLPNPLSPARRLPAGLLLGALLVSLLLNHFLPYRFADHSINRVETSLEKVTDVGAGAPALNPKLLQPPFADFWNALRPLLGDRTAMLASSMAMALDAPWLGQGTGSFVAVYPAYSNKYPQFRDALSSATTFTTNPHNVVMQVASQNGFPAVLLFLFLIGALWVRLILALWRRWDGWVATGLVAISAAIFDSMFNHVFFNPASMFVFALLGGACWGRISGDAPVRDVMSFSLPWNRTLSTLLLVALLVLFAVPLRWMVSEYYIGQALQDFNQRQGAQGMKNIDHAYAWDPSNKYALHFKGDIAYRQGRFDESIGYLLRLQKLRPNDFLDLNLLAANYIRTRRFALAEKLLLRVIAIQPRFASARTNLQIVRRVMRQPPAAH